MKKILYVTFVPPSNFSGGGIVIKQSILSLSEKYTIDYIGVENQDNEISMKVNNIGTLLPEKKLFKRLLNLLSGKTTSYYNSWSAIKTEIKLDEYESIYIEFTKFDFVAKFFKERGKKIFLRAHNVEYDYYFNVYKYNKTIFNFLRYKLVFHQEYRCLKNSDKILCLHENDSKRFLSLYPKCVQKSKIEILPVCIKKPNVLEQIENSNKIKFLLTGSLSYAPNVDGAIWFIQNIWTDFLGENELILAGSNPSELLKNEAKKFNNIKLISNPEDMNSIFNDANVYVAPIFNGAGMKVKVAEALSYGLVVIGTTHAFIGYKVENEKEVYVANSPKEFKIAIRNYLDLGDVQKKCMRERINKLFHYNYSIYSSAQKMGKVIEGTNKYENK